MASRFIYTSNAAHKASASSVCAMGMVLGVGGFIKKSRQYTAQKAHDRIRMRTLLRKGKVASGRRCQECLCVRVLGMRKNFCGWTMLDDFAM